MINIVNWYNMYYNQIIIYKGELKIMGNKKTVQRVIIIIILAVLLTVFGFTTTDRIRFDNGYKPIFAVLYEGGECNTYRGVCYSVTYLYPETVDGEDQYGNTSFWSWFWEE